MEANRDEYYQRLRNISEQQDWNNWIAFFLQAITIQAGKNSNRVRKIMALYEEMKIKIHEITHSQYSVHLLDAIFSKPVFRVNDTSKQLNHSYNIHEKTAASLLRKLKDAKLLTELQTGGGRRSATLCFPALINLAEGKRVL